MGVEENALVTAGPGNETSTNGGSNGTMLDATSKSRRFEGFMSWERMLQEWADDVQEYLDQVERESLGVDYAFGNFGRGSKTADLTTAKEERATPTETPSAVIDSPSDLKVTE